MLNTEKLPVLPNFPLGVMPGMVFQEQETRLGYDDTLFLYTDGLTEAENASSEQFGEERMKAFLGTKRNAQALLDAMQEAVDCFVSDAPQSDDLTVLVIHYMAHPATEQQERHLILHNDIQQIPQLAEFVETIAEEKQLDQSLAMSLNLALEEAVTNVILYADPKGVDGLVDVEAILKPHSLEFIITDSGVPFDPTAVPEADVTLSADERPIGGLGIYLVNKLMDELHYQRIDDKNVLSMKKNI
jgi:sigma-B regulation protein RsbU (phosphoserine phosphatase)